MTHRSLRSCLWNEEINQSIIHGSLHLFCLSYTSSSFRSPTDLEHDDDTYAFSTYNDMGKEEKKQYKKAVNNLQKKLKSSSRSIHRIPNAML